MRSENGERKTENGICENLLFCEFNDSTNAKQAVRSRHSEGALAKRRIS